MLKTIGSLFYSAILFFCSSFVMADCVEFEAEAKAYSGLVPNLDDAGRIKSFSMYGEGTFIFPDRSLISNARVEAELTAKRSFAVFLKEGFNADTVTAKLMESEKLIDQDGNSSAIAKEIKSNLETMSQNVETTLSGIIKLDECVNTKDKYVLVKMGWSPKFSDAASKTSRVIANDIARGENNTQNVPDKKVGSSSKIEPVEGYRKKSSLSDDF